MACEFSGIVRDAFAALGHDAWSCDMLPTERPGQHIQADVLKVLGWDWDMMVAHPPCTYLARSGARWRDRPGREELAQQALEFVLTLYEAPVPRLAIENPIGRLNQLWRYPDQVIQPYWFGDPYAKTTNLWLKDLPPLVPTQWQVHHQPWVQANYVTRVTRTLRPAGKARHPKDRSRTMPGFARAMAEQWGVEQERWQQLGMEFVA